MSSPRTVGTFLRVGTCSETLCNVLDRGFGHPMEVEERATMSLAGGILQHGHQCGQIWGATLAAGARTFRLLGSGPRSEATAVLVARRLVEAFRGRYGSIDCIDITGLDESSSASQMLMFFFGKAGAVGCFRMAARFAREAYGEIAVALDGEPAEPPAPPVSCTALLAERSGASELHAVMAAGLAGGIGLSGGACGALGAAIWLDGMKAVRDGAGAKALTARGEAIVEAFGKETGFELECSKIAGRRFDTVAGHAAYLRDGGCSRLIAVLAGC